MTIKSSETLREITKYFIAKAFVRLRSIMLTLRNITKSYEALRSFTLKVTKHYTVRLRIFRIKLRNIPHKITKYFT